MSTTANPRWVWRNPAQSSAWVARFAAVLLALPCMANVLLVKLARDKGYFQWTISASAAIAAVVLLYRAISGRQSQVTEYGILLGTGMWAANSMEIATSTGVSTFGIMRNGGFYLTYAMLTGLFYLAERVGYRTDDTPVTKAVEIVDQVVDQVGVENVAAAMLDIDAVLVAEVVVEAGANGNGNGPE
jgi:hypothetical protein